MSGPRNLIARRDMGALRWVMLLVGRRLAEFDDGVQAGVDAVSFALQRIGVRKSAQLAACFLVLAANVAIDASEAIRAGQLLAASVMTLAIATWVAMAYLNYESEQMKERLGFSGVPRRRSAIRFVALAFMLGHVARWLHDGEVSRSMVVFDVAYLVAAYLVSTPGQPPPRKPRRALVPSPVST